MVLGSIPAFALWSLYALFRLLRVLIVPVFARECACVSVFFPCDAVVTGVFRVAPASSSTHKPTSGEKTKQKRKEQKAEQVNRGGQGDVGESTAGEKCKLEKVEIRCELGLVTHTAQKITESEAGAADSSTAADLGKWERVSLRTINNRRKASRKNRGAILCICVCKREGGQQA